MPGNVLVLAEREEILVGILEGRSVRSIAAGLGRAPSTVSREINRNGGRRGYRPVAAEERARRCRGRPKVPKLWQHARLGRRVGAELTAGYSPAAIAARLRAEGGVSVCHETIYRALYHDEFRGVSVLAHQCLRTRRRRRQRRLARQTRARQFGGFRLIDERPGHVWDRAEPGHWEGDLIIGANRRSAVITLVERTSRLVVLGALPGRRHTADAVAKQLIELFATVPPALAKTLTWDQGMEMARWQQTQAATGVEIFFCHPHSPWQRPSNENANRLIRYWLPKRTDLARHSQVDLDRVANIINTSPRRIHKWRTARAVYDDHAVALTM